MPEIRNFGPLAVTINGRSLGEKQFVYLRFKVSEGLLNVVLVETDEVIHVKNRMEVDNLLFYDCLLFSQFPRVT
jgi:hypothetical protein